MEEEQKTVRERRKAWETFPEGTPPNPIRSEQPRSLTESDVPAVRENINQSSGQQSILESQDDDDFKDALSENPQSSGVDAPIAGQNSDIIFEDGDEALVIRWPTIHNIDHYVLLCKRKDEEIKRNTHVAECELATKVYAWKTGERISVYITAIDKKAKAIDVCQGVHVKGGDCVPSDVELMFHGEISFRSLVLNWKKPKREPQEYEVKVYHKDQEKEYLTNSFITKATSAVLSNLKHLTEYYCVINAKYPGFDGIPVRSNFLKTEDSPSEKHKVPRVHAIKNPRNRVREITVTWEKPQKDTDISRFDVYLEYSINGGKLKTEVHEVKSGLQTSFKHLKSDTTYTACVVSVGRSAKKSVAAYSDPVTTDPAKKIPNFDIKLQGKPTIETCAAKQKSGDILSKFEWSLPDIGIENLNYKCVWVGASVAYGDKSQVLEVEEGNRSTKPVKLKWGMEYSFNVQCNYLDYDSEEMFETSATEILCTDVGKPTIDSVRWKEKEITIQWSKANGAKKHLLKVLDEAREPVFEPKILKHDTYSFTMTPSCSYGVTCNFLIEASCGSGQPQTAIKSVLIGGDCAVTKVLAKKDAINPRRAITVTWQQPNRKPEGYTLKLLDSTAKKTKLGDQDVAVLESTITFYKFVELKTKTFYTVQVCPMYNGVAMEGTASNAVETERRNNNMSEKQSEFGQPEKIIHAVKANTPDVTVTELSWTSVQMGENFKVIGYRVFIHQKGLIMNTTILDKQFGPQETKIEVDLKKGQKFDVKLTTVYFDLDSRSKRADVYKLHEIYTDPKQTNINDCTWRDGLVYFSWQSVSGAKRYQLLIKDELLSDNLAPDVFSEVEGGIHGDGCKAKVQMSEELRVGRTCMTKVLVHSEGGRTSETDWKAHLIGGNRVPRNVKASRNLQNPKRAINITFDCPRDGHASEYKIVAFPETGRRKIFCSKSSNEVLEYLRTGTRYKFEVYGKWGSKWSEGSSSNSITTEGNKPESPLPDFQNIQKTTVDLTDAIFYGHVSSVNVALGKDFGQVQDLNPDIKNARDKDIMTLKWRIPSFDNNSDKYKVEIYKVEVKKKHESGGKADAITFVKNRFDYESKSFDLELGEVYEFCVSTIYFDIDQDIAYMSSAVKKEVVTRPCVPNCRRNNPKDNVLTIEWNAARGAKKYGIEIFTDNASEPCIRHDMQKETVYKKQFDENFGYGATYHAVITAYGADNKTNSDTTAAKTIGGDLVPTNVQATSSNARVTDPNTQVFLSWTKPQHDPKSYKVESIPYVKSMGADFVGETCLVSGLKAGTDYNFKVMALHIKDGKPITSGGSLSNKIQTNPTPTQVKNVWTSHGENPSTGIEVQWDEVDAEKEDEKTKYRVRLRNKDDSTIRQEIVETEEVIFHGLEPGTEYFATVAGGNSAGFGRDSEKVKCKTVLGTPKNVHLIHNKDKPGSALKLEFSDAEGRVTKYIATLYKCLGQVEQPVLTEEEVKSGREYTDLESNCEYLAKVYAVFANGNGQPVASERAMTAPSKALITNHGSTGDGDQKSSREIFVKWKSDAECDAHEVQVICGPTGVVETIISVTMKNELTYSCLNEAVQYTVRVRSKNASKYYGDWSDERIIHLAPAKLQGASALLQKDGYDILVTCKIPKKHSPFYFMQVLSDDKPVTQPIRAEAKVDNEMVEWRFTPHESAKEYICEIWAEDSGKIKGESTRTNSVISRPSEWELKSVKTCEASPSTDIEFTWEPQNRCDWYEVNICATDQQDAEAVVRTQKTSYIYRCKSPGNTYVINLRAVRESICGQWSEDQSVILAPGEITLEEDQRAQNDPVACIEIAWKPLTIPSEGYLVVLFCNDQEMGKFETTDTKQSFEGELLKPGSLCHCSVAAYNGNKIGKATTSKKYRIEWVKPSYFSIIADDIEPSRRAKMSWDKPAGVNCFKLEIENNQTGVTTTEKFPSEKYVFESGIPGCSYSVRLFCGCDDWYDISCLKKTMTMQPEPPTDVKVFANSHVDGLTIEFKDSPSMRKQYEITAEALANPENKIVKTITQHSLTLRGLVPGESYKVSVVTVIEDSRSNAATSEGYIPTFPEEVKNTRSKIENGSVLFEWDKLDIKPDKYIVQWRVDNEPITDEHTQASTFMIFFLKPAHCYSVRVMAENSSGIGPMSLWENFITDPSPPYNVNVYPDPESPETSLIVKFQDEKDSLKRYRITAKGRDEEPKIVVTHEHFGILTGLKSGREYMVTVQTLFCGKESTGAPYSRI